MLGIPEKRGDIIAFANDLVEKCTGSLGARQAFYKTINTVCEAGRGDGRQSLINLCYNHIDRSAANLFSPTELKFKIGFTNPYPKAILDRAALAASMLTETWQNDNTDLMFAAGVQEALKLGACIQKQWVQPWGAGESPRYYSGLVMPWNFGVYSENENGLESQSALCETTVLTMPEAWQRISQLQIPEAEQIRLFKKVQASSKSGGQADWGQNFFRQVFSTAPLNTNAASGSVGGGTPGGVVWMGNQAMGTLAPQVTADVTVMRELWVQDVEDWVTIQLIEPDILITPQPTRNKENLLFGADYKSGLHPYTLIQPNITPGYFWGRSELTDLIAPQGMLSQLADDIMRLFGLQVEKILAFFGYDGLSDEKYDEMRSAGYFNGPPGATVTDLTPKFPTEGLPLLKAVMEIYNLIGGNPEIMQGKGESGVRAGVHANTLLKTASPRPRQQSLIVERQCAAAAELTLSLMQAKDDRQFWTKADKPTDAEETGFHLTDLPDDRRVSVDSHSSSPIFADDHQQLVAFGLKSGFITKHGAIDLLNLPDKELLHAQLKEEEERQAKQMQEIKQQDPELFEKLLLKKSGGGHR
jgi:hypothetical protein